MSIWDNVASFFEETYKSTVGPIDTVISSAVINKYESTAPTSTPTALDLSFWTSRWTRYVATRDIEFFNKHPEKASQLVLMGSVAS